MKPPKNFGSEEECESSESGWTMYIGSHIEDDDGDVDNMDEEGTTTHQGYPQDDESDDSMVSDASSGPSHQHGNDIGKRGVVNYGLQGFKQVVVEETQYDNDDDDDDDESKYCLEKKAIKTVEKKMEEKKLDGKGKSSVQGGGKVRKRK
ncbi:protein SOB FIVE-LIKE 3-like [Vicia villosa]|uniref:protein SOB FIVE-LIKE 3-like n=1 Tax=Vicia villosa TaxID=3911 RepID=UPI00273C7ACC|nr:protein SOB FIVE-LIKE 3-like [Vicia villosa]